MFQANDVVTFGLFESEDSEEAKQFIIAAGITKYPSAHSFDAAIGAKHGLKAPAVVLFKNVSSVLASHGCVMCAVRQPHVRVWLVVGRGRSV